MADDGNGTAHVFGGQCPPRGVLPDHRDLNSARGAGRLRPNDTEASLAATSQCEDVARAHARQKTTRFISCLALACSCAGLLRLTQLVAQRQVLADIAVRTRQVLGRRVALSLQLGESRSERA